MHCISRSNVRVVCVCIWMRKRADQDGRVWMVEVCVEMMVQFSVDVYEKY